LREDIVDVIKRLFRKSYFNRNRTFRSSRFGLAVSVWAFRSGPFRSRDISVWPFQSGDISVTAFLFINNLLQSFI